MNTQPNHSFTDRLTTLSTGQLGLRSTLSVSVEALAATEIENQNSKIENPVLDFVASDETLDRFGEVISVSGWRLENYRRNPVFQNAHQYGDILFTLGKAIITEVRQVGTSRRDVLFQRIQFATDVNPMARIAYGLYKGKFLNAVSVGFIPLCWEDGPAADSPRPSDGRGAGGEGCRRRYLEQELLEVSAVGIPANPEALQLGLKSGAIERTDIRETLELLREVLSAPGRPDRNKSLLSLTAKLHKLLKI